MNSLMQPVSTLRTSDSYTPKVGALRASLCNVPRDAPLALFAAKTNFGHLEGGAGIVGLLKAALMLQRGVRVPSLHLRTTNPHLEVQPEL